jgi:hypothetical protein
MSKRWRLLLVAVVVAVALLATAAPAFAVPCENPTGNHTGWVFCGDG